MAIANNPIGGVGLTSSSIAPLTWTPVAGGASKDVRAPATYLYRLEDVSAADSGRTENTKMYKNMVGQVVGIELSWTNLPTREASAILNAFNHEYLYVKYLDLQQGKMCIAEFYVGNRAAPLYNSTLNVWQNLSFKIIQRNGQVSPTPAS